MKPLSPDDLVPYNVFVNDFPVIIDVTYALNDHPDNHFKDVYHPTAQTMWGHKDMVAVTLHAAQICHRDFGWTLKINDGLRPIEAQRNMEGFGVHPLLLSKPGGGAHPRGMAIDVEPLDENGVKIPMGTTFDHFVDDPEHFNPNARDYSDLPDNILQNRKNLENAFIQAGEMHGRPVWPLPQEWWDFRFKPDDYLRYAPLSDSDLYPYQIMTSKQLQTKDYSPSIVNEIEQIRKSVLKTP